MSKRNLAVLLLRNSHASQDVSLDRQRSDGERFARSHGLKIWRRIPGVPADAFDDGAFIDDSISGDLTHLRRGFQALIEAAQRPGSRIRHIICYDIWRFGRFDVDEAGYYRHMLKQHGVEVIYVAEAFRGDASDDLVRNVKQWQGHEYLKDLSKVTQSGQIKLAKKGFWLGGIPPHGLDLRYEDAAGKLLFIVRFMPDGSKLMLDLQGGELRRFARGERIVHSSSDRARLCLSEQSRVDLIIEIFEMYASGLGYKTIADILNQRGVAAPRDGNWSKRHKRGWSHGTIRNIIQNPAYLGRLVFNRTSFSRFHQIKNGPNGPASVAIPPVRATKITRLSKKDWVVAEVLHDRVISDDLWNRSQAQRRDRRKPHARGSRSVYVFTGLADCKACDHHYQGHTTTKGKARKDGSPVRTRSYLCGGYDSKGTAICPTRWSVREDVLWNAIIENIERQYGWILRSPAFANAVRERAREIMERPSPHGASVTELQAEKRRIVRKVHDLATNVSSENLSMLDGVLTDLRSRVEEIDALIADHEPAEAAAKTVGTAVTAKACADLRSAFETIHGATPSLKRRFVRQLVERIELDPRTKTGTAWLWRLPKSVLDSLGLSVSRIAGAGLEPATSGL